MSPRTRINMRGGGYVVVTGTPRQVWARLLEPTAGLRHPKTDVITTWIDFDGSLVDARTVEALYPPPRPYGGMSADYERTFDREGSRDA